MCKVRLSLRCTVEETTVFGRLVVIFTDKISMTRMQNVFLNSDKRNWTLSKCGCTSNTLWHLLEEIMNEIS